MTERKKKKPERVGNVGADLLAQRGLRDRVEQAGIIPDWTRLVGEQIAAVTEPRSVSANGTLFVDVTTNAMSTFAAQRRAATSRPRSATACD